ncbi:MAG: hypothetical protein GXP50_04800 [Deltaproteobacteria bacterium]|nr:hypothetical protein [Deltaproteobacteria bacterium]
MQKSPKEIEIQELLAPVVEDAGYEVVDLRLRTEAGRLVLRLLVDRVGSRSTSAPASAGN